MTVGDRGALAIVELLFYVIALPVSVFVASKHGFGRSAGWLFLIVLSCLRIGASIAELVAINTESSGAYTAAAILANVGFSALLAAQLGILKRLHEGMKRGRIDPRFFLIILLLVIVGLIIAINGGVRVYSSSASDPPKQSSIDLLRDSSIIFIVAFGVLALCVLYTFVQIGNTIPSDRILLYAIGASLPFLLVRCIYNILQSYQVDTTRFNSITGSVAITATMSILMEFITVILYLGAGWRAPKIRRDELKMGKWADQDPEAKMPA